MNDLRTYLDIIQENSLSEEVTPQDYEVYHFTDGKAFNQIMETDELGAHTSHKVGSTDNEENLNLKDTLRGAKTVNGISVTRNPLLDIQHTYSIGGEKLFRLGLNKRLLSNNHKIIPYRDIYLRDTPRIAKSGRSDEMEEFIVGSVRPLSKYLTSVGISIELLEGYDHDYYDEFVLGKVLSSFLTDKQHFQVMGEPNKSVPYDIIEGKKLYFYDLRRKNNMTAYQMLGL